MEQRRKFSKEFKLEAVNMMLGRDVSIAQVARDLGVNLASDRTYGARRSQRQFLERFRISLDKSSYTAKLAT